MLAPNMLDAPVGQARGGNLPLQCQNKALLQTSSYRPYPLKITSLFNTVSLLGLWDIFWCRCSRGNIHRHAERQNFPGKVRLLSSGVSVLQLLKTVLMSWHVLATLAWCPTTAYINQNMTNKKKAKLCETGFRYLVASLVGSLPLAISLALGKHLITGWLIHKDCKAVSDTSSPAFLYIQLLKQILV